MPPSKTRFVTACQQLLALAVVLAALTPAASVVSLDVIHQQPGSAVRGSGEAAGDLAAYTRASSRKSLVPTEVVDPVVTEYSLTPPAGAKRASSDLLARAKPGALSGSTQVTSLPQPVTGYGAIGVTWQQGEAVSDDEISFRARTLTDDTWSEWRELEYHDDHGPDPDSLEGQHARPGTAELLVGEVDEVQVQAVSVEGVVPADMKLAVIAPGEAEGTAVEAPELDTNVINSRAAAPSSMAQGAGDPVPTPEEPTDPTDPTDSTDGTDEVDLQASSYTPKPVIYSRSQWGADERMRDKSSLRYFEVHAGFVHHTVNSNNYSRDEVPGILRSIYAYHTQSKGWSDVGYNYLVDRFGRIWEGRYGGVDRAVVGAHTLGYNDYAFAMSAIGNYDVKKPSSAVVQAYGALLAWKLSLHGVDASATSQQVGPKRFPAINGHRDAGSTACPGRYLYAKLGKIRRLAGATQRGWAGRELQSNLAATPHPDLIVRRASDGRAFIIPTGGLTEFKAGTTLRAPWSASDTVVLSPDLTGDGHSDFVVQAANGSAQVYPGDGAGGLGEPIKKSSRLAGHDLLTAVGDLTGDGKADLVGRQVETGRLALFIGGGQGGFARKLVAGDWSSYNLLAATGDVNGDRHDDLLARDGAGALWLFAGTGSRKLAEPVQVPGSYGAYSTISGFGDFDRDGRRDLFVRKGNRAGFLLPANGDGTFGHRLGPVARVRGASNVIGGDLTGNAAADLVARRGDQLVVYPSAGTFETGARIDTGIRVRNANLLLNVGDWNRDGYGDIMTRTRKGALYLRPGDGAGRFGKPVRIAKGFGKVSLLAAVGDMTGDGWPDLMGQPAGGAMRIYPGRGTDGLKYSFVAHGEIDAGTQIGIGRWDGDGSPDSLFRKGDALTLFPGNGPGGLTNPQKLGLKLARYDWVVGVSDVNLTGHPDLLVRERASGNLWLIRATADGFSKRRFMASGMKEYDLAG